MIVSGAAFLIHVLMMEKTISAMINDKIFDACDLVCRPTRVENAEADCVMSWLWVHHFFSTPAMVSCDDAVTAWA